MNCLVMIHARNILLSTYPILTSNHYHHTSLYQRQYHYLTTIPSPTNATTTLHPTPPTNNPTTLHPSPLTKTKPITTITITTTIRGEAIQQCGLHGENA